MVIVRNSSRSIKVGSTPFAEETILARGSTELADDHWSAILKKYRAGLRQYFDAGQLEVLYQIETEDEPVHDQSSRRKKSPMPKKQKRAKKAAKPRKK